MNHVRSALVWRLDPWNPSYDSAIQLEDDESGAPEPADPFVETEDWRALEPEPSSRPSSITFVDGVQRVDTRVIGEDNGRLVYGAFASICVGAVLAVPEKPSVHPGTPLRVLALSDGVDSEPIEISCGRLTLSFKGQPTAACGPQATHDAIQTARRDAETRLAELLVAEGHPLVIVDGRLNLQPTRKTMVVGLVKSIHKQYLPETQQRILSELRCGTRTPIFRIPRDRSLYSWYIRLCIPRPVDHSWAGLVRIETLDTVGLAAAVRLADLTAQHLPDFASSPIRDPRAPQNLYPISALEDRLRRQLGDPDFIRRSIETHFYRTGVGA